MEFVCKATNDEKGITTLDCASTKGNDIDPHLFKGGVKVNIHDAKKADAKSGCGCSAATNAKTMVSAAANFPPDCSCFEQATLPFSGIAASHTFSNGVTVSVSTGDAGFVWTATGNGVRAVSFADGLGGYDNYSYDGTVKSATVLAEVYPDTVTVCVDTRVPPVFDLQLQTATSIPYARLYDWSLAASASPVTLAVGETYFDNVNFTATADYLNTHLVVLRVGFVTSSSEPIIITGVTVQPDGDLEVLSTLPFTVLPGTIKPIELRSGVQTNLTSQNFTVNVTAQSDTPGCELYITKSVEATVQHSAPTNPIAFIDQNAVLSFNGVNTTLSAPLSGGSVSYTGSQQIGPYAACGEFTVTATGTLTAPTSGSQTTASVDIPVSVPCATGCTLSQGYWKTHSQKGPAPYDPTWALVPPNQEDSPFFQSAQSYYQVLNAAPRGNVYYILAVQYIAAELNKLKGTLVPPDVAETYASAKLLLEKYTPAQVASLSTQDPDKLLFNSDAKALEKYNSGLAGVIACNQDA